MYSKLAIPTAVAVLSVFSFAFWADFKAWQEFGTFLLIHLHLCHKTLLAPYIHLMFSICSLQTEQNLTTRNRHWWHATEPQRLPEDTSMGTVSLLERAGPA
jgi:hypothetical protein